LNGFLTQETVEQHKKTAPKPEPPQDGKSAYLNPHRQWAVTMCEQEIRQKQGAANTLLSQKLIISSLSVIKRFLQCSLYARWNAHPAKP